MDNNPALLSPLIVLGKNTGAALPFLSEDLPAQDSNATHLLQLLHWQVDSIPLCHQGSPGPRERNGKMVSMKKREIGKEDRRTSESEIICTCSEVRKQNSRSHHRKASKA